MPFMNYSFFIKFSLWSAANATVPFKNQNISLSKNLMNNFFVTFEKTKSRCGISSSSHSGITFHSFLCKSFTHKFHLMIFLESDRSGIYQKTNVGSENQLKEKFQKHLCKPSHHNVFTPLLKKIGKCLIIKLRSLFSAD